MIENIKEMEMILNERPDIAKLLFVVKDDPELIEATIVLSNILSKKEDVQVSRLYFFPEEDRAYLGSKAVDGVIPFDEFVKAITEMTKPTEQREKLREVRSMLSKQPVGTFIENMDVIKGISEMEKDDCMRANYIFMYGYIQGIRAERARRKRGLSYGK